MFTWKTLCGRMASRKNNRKGHTAHHSLDVHHGWYYDTHCAEEVILTLTRVRRGDANRAAAVGKRSSLVYFFFLVVTASTITRANANTIPRLNVLRCQDHDGNTFPLKCNLMTESQYIPVFCTCSEICVPVCLTAVVIVFHVICLRRRLVSS